MFRSFFPVPSVIPITDIKGMEAAKYTKQEKQLRCKVASLYRIIDLNGWSYGDRRNWKKRSEHDAH
jgi:adducin